MGWEQKGTSVPVLPPSALEVDTTSAAGGGTGLPNFEAVCVSGCDAVKVCRYYVHRGVARQPFHCFKQFTH